jgi:adenylate kinase
MKKNIILIGAPGSGKGTQSSYIVSRYNLHVISTGDLLRKAQSDESNPFRHDILSATSRGKLVGSNIVSGLIELEIENNKGKGFLFDGFPRSLEQNDILQNILKKYNFVLDAVIYLEIKKAFLIERIINRFFCSKCGEVYNKITKKPLKDGFCDKCNSQDFKLRSDDNVDVINERFRVFETEAVPILGYYIGQNIVFTLDATQDIPSLNKEIDSIFEKI